MIFSSCGAVVFPSFIARVSFLFTLLASVPVGKGEQREMQLNPISAIPALCRPLSLLLPSSALSAQQQQPALLWDTLCSPEGLGQDGLSQEPPATEGVHSAGEGTRLAAEPWKKQGTGHVLHHATTSSCFEALWEPVL